MVDDPTLSEANREVQVTDHLLTVTYPMAKDPKLLISVVDHGRKAIEGAAAAVVRFEMGRGYVPAVQVSTPREAVAAIGDLTRIGKLRLTKAQEATRLYSDLCVTMERFRESPAVFSRGERFVIADEGFSYLREITPDELKRALRTIKDFVHEANKHVMIGGAT